MRIVAACRIGLLSIAGDYLRLSRGPSKVSFWDYTRLRLFDREFWAGEDRRNVVGQSRSLQIWTTINYRVDWWGCFDSKLASTAYLSAFGFPVILVRAICCENATASRADRVLTDGQALRCYLQHADHYPLFGKPAEGNQSLGPLTLRRHRPDADGVETFDGRVITFDELTGELSRHYTEGYVFQPLMVPHDTIRAVCGDRLATIRVLPLRTGRETPQVLRACWKIPAGGNMADNLWHDGNLVAKLDLETGAVECVLSGSGVDLASQTHHPDTGANLIGFRLPCWDAVPATAQEAARVIEQAPLIGWGIAGLDDGPVIVEMNERPDFILPQLADSRGMLDAQLLDFMAVRKEKAAARRAEL
jgi:hypothetical protein